MPSFVSPALYIDFARLPPPDVIEALNYETILNAYKSRALLAKPELEYALQLEQSPTNVILETEAYGELLLRARVNDAARAVMLAFSTGTDLEALVGYHNITRMEGETDAQLRRRGQLATEAYATAGSEGAYVFHALSADPDILDASATSTRPGRVDIRIIRKGSDPMPTDEQIEKVREVLHRPKIKPLTDIVQVNKPVILHTDIVANVTLYPGPSSSLVSNDITTAINKLRNRISLLGRDLLRGQIITALNPEGVHSVELTSPAQDYILDKTRLVKINTVSINFSPLRKE